MPDGSNGSDNYVLGQSSSMLRGLRWRTVENSTPYLIPYLKPGLAILDVGCGPGTITVDLASRFPKGTVIGLDVVSLPLQDARTYAEERGVTNVEFKEGDVLSLPFADATFDIVHAHQCIQHSGDPVQALREMRRVTRSGGLIAVREMDFGSAIWFPDIPALREYHVMCPKVAITKGSDMHAGRKLLTWALAAGFKREDVTTTAGTWCYSTPEERSYWSSVLSEVTLVSGLGKAAVTQGVISQEELERMAHAWEEWGATEDGWYAVVHGQISGSINARRPGY
ncbi:hypothetical protein CERSUDRAFT_125924 [Gelatoporia subvermispora B]|uniref:Methyltransferase domain-containing protein n=1 Tax=Ceriporiopsis subvermispora (strain B) TaxID=914234 RepID=M2PD24_CERS8|nr:hypothetical protein CERSUDRAFT_125924 [Gelatoporia subvermispora B]